MNSAVEHLLDGYASKFSARSTLVAAASNKCKADLRCPLQLSFARNWEFVFMHRQNLKKRDYRAGNRQEGGFGTLL